MKKIVRLVFHLFMFTVLTMLTQVGGVVYLLTMFIAFKTKQKKWYVKFAMFVLIYTLTTFLIVPLLASAYGRQRVINSSNLEEANLLTVWLNRNYVSKDMNLYLSSVSKELQQKYPIVKIRYLDACFPFFEGFPLLPHLSHNDGKKIDFSLVYCDASGKIVNKSKSNSGYGVFEDPTPFEYDQTRQCLKQGFWQYQFPKYLTLGRINDYLQFSEDGTRQIIEALLSSKKTEKIFIEPHLKNRLGLNDSRVRYQGCKSVRHDDHIHVQIK